MTVLSGSHTIGQAGCGGFRDRIYNQTNIDPAFATTRRANCPSSGGDQNLAPLDVQTPTQFENTYFQNLSCSIMVHKMLWFKHIVKTMLGFSLISQQLWLRWEILVQLRALLQRSE
ncbi:hypothetical protein MKW94_027251 [Papaver nudicaule]|uniref:Plant heme peroxidase family profile domain-containing protein n=1 Tax=Papaver nudicaule TaxID=74823 RepID=A0AA42B3E1_PAPNU|nr:hypothetical protein [Papaver nudicaule]